jgi:hypothetical protein
MARKKRTMVARGTRNKREGGITERRAMYGLGVGVDMAAQWVYEGRKDTVIYCFFNRVLKRKHGEALSPF